MEDEEIIDPRQKVINDRKAKIAAILEKRKKASANRETALSEREKAVLAKKELLKKKRAEREQQIADFKAKRDAEIKAKRDARESEIQKKKDFEAEGRQLASDFDKEEAIRRAGEIAKKAEDDNYDWNYIGGDENTANKRQRIEIIEGEKEVEEIIKKKRLEPGHKPTGVSWQSAWDKLPDGKKREFGSIENFKREGTKFNEGKKPIEVVSEEKIIKKVPTKEEKIITQTREDWIKTQHWAEGLPKGLISSLAISMRKRGNDMTPKELYEIFKSQTSEKESAEWARKNGYGYLLGGGGRRGSSTSRGKTNFN
jgi:hypothetical protein